LRIKETINYISKLSRASKRAKRAKRASGGEQASEASGGKRSEWAKREGNISRQRKLFICFDICLFF